MFSEVTTSSYIFPSLSVYDSEVQLTNMLISDARHDSTLLHIVKYQHTKNIYFSM